MQAVSANFISKVNAPRKQTDFAVMLGWSKQINPTTRFFNLDSSALDGGDFLKGSGDVVTFFDKYVYTDESRYVKNFKISKKVSSYSWGVVTAQATITLNNTTGRFLPEKDPVIGKFIKAGRPIKILTGYDGEMITNFVGFVGTPTVNIVEQTVELTAFDAITYLDTKYSNLPAFVGKFAHEIVRDLLIEQGFSTDQFEIDRSQQVAIGYLSPKDKSVTDLLKELAEAEAALVFVDEQGIIRFWNRTHLAKTQPTAHTFSYSNLTNLQIKSTPVINSAQVVAKPFKVQAFQKLWELEQGSEQTKIKAGKTIDIFAEFQDNVGDFYAVSVDRPIHASSNSGTSMYSGARSSDGTGGAISVQLVSVYNFGSTYKMTFRNNSSVDGYINRIQLWGVPAKVTQVITENAVSEPSIEQYGVNPDTSTGVGAEILKIENNLVQDVGGARAIANNIVTLYSNPNRQFKLDNFFVPYLQIGDTVDLQIDELADSFNCFITSYELAGGVNANFRQSLEVEERPKVSVFELDRSTLDGGDVLAN